jgi:osmotically-inducible protein OsmY
MECTMLPHVTSGSPDQRVRRVRDIAVDFRPQELVERRLRESGYRCLRTIRCEDRQGVLTLRGRVPSFYHKQVAQALVAAVAPVAAVVDLIEVA